MVEGLHFGDCYAGKQSMRVGSSVGGVLLQPTLGGARALQAPGTQSALDIERQQEAKLAKKYGGLAKKKIMPKVRSGSEFGFATPTQPYDLGNG